MKGVSDVGLSETMKALGDPVRREILNLLKGGRMTAGDIASRFDMTAATVSYHLAQLKKAGLIFESREKNFIYYYRALYGEFGLWVRPAAMWNEIVERDGKTYRRFTYLGE